MKIDINSVQELGLIMRASRKTQRVRLDDLAGSAKLSPVFVGDTERGKESVQLGKVLRLMRELGIKMIVEVPDEVKPLIDKIRHQGMRPAKKRPGNKTSPATQPEGSAA